MERKEYLSTDPEVINGEVEQPDFEIKNCEFCGKPLVYRALVFSKNHIKWLDMPKMCTCPGAKAAREAEDKAREEREAAWRKQRQAEEEELKRQEEEEERRAQRQRFYEHLDSLGLSKRQRNHKFENYEVLPENKAAFTALQSYANNFATILEKSPEETCNGLFLFGPVGVGKTHLTAALVRQVGCSNDHTAYIMSLVQFLEASKRSFNQDPRHSYWLNHEYNPQTAFNNALNAELLVLDDLGKETPSSWSLTKLYEIINHRYEQLLPTVITSNYTPEELQELFQKAVPDKELQIHAIIDRILESSHVIAMSGESYRLRNKR